MKGSQWSRINQSNTSFAPTWNFNAGSCTRTTKPFRKFINISGIGNQNMKCKGPAYKCQKWITVRWVGSISNLFCRWVYQYGPAALGLASTLSAFYINYHFRETLYLLNYTRLSSYAIMFCAPGLSAGVLHYLVREYTLN